MRVSSPNPYEPPKSDHPLRKPSTTTSTCPVCGEATNRWRICFSLFGYRCKSCDEKLWFEIGRDAHAWLALAYVVCCFGSMVFDRTVLYSNTNFQSFYVVFFIFIVASPFLRLKYGVLTSRTK